MTGQQSPVDLASDRFWAAVLIVPTAVLAVVGTVLIVGSAS
ncbi:hypothetical protein [Curtobacterium sp. MCBA15_004]|nr:hypothetical protein [Curtobacterium sp. MCBA15_004]WIA95839.1 hypothetical protein QOL16_12040 [Curtobacterium sp. MCBA15_004]